MGSSTGGPSALAELLSEAGNGCRLRRLGLPRSFTAHYGRQEDLLRFHGLDDQSIVRQVRDAVRA